MARVFIGVGSNEGDRLQHLSNAIQALAGLRGARVAQMAMMVESDPVGGPPQGPYLNTVVELKTSLAPRALLDHLQAIERRLGRRPSAQRWAPRPIDLDLLLYDDLVLEEPGLCVPHPRMHERRFVLQPLCQLAPDLVHPVLRQPVAALLAQTVQQRTVPLTPGP